MRSIQAIFFIGSLFSVPAFAVDTPIEAQSAEDKGLLWIAGELNLIREASLQMQARQLPAPTDKFNYEALNIDLTRIINEINAKVAKRANPAYQFEPLLVEQQGY